MILPRLELFIYLDIFFSSLLLREKSSTLEGKKIPLEKKINISVQEIDREEEIFFYKSVRKRNKIRMGFTTTFTDKKKTSYNN